ncbi:MAG: nicotinate-nucleotide adenylyltransferase [Afipia sp.]|nr:nicotinate-nucleotide adenylyltransferase [Afipia sp.]
MNDSFVSEPNLPRPLPIHTDGMRIGLLGGSFNPPHEAHRAISLFALKRLKLDRIWWLVSPGNPLKNNGALHALRERMTAAEKVANDPRIDISCLETVIGTRYTADTISYLRRRCSGVRFVWIMGADNLAQFNRWERWQTIASMVPIAVVDRPPDSFRALSSIAAQTLMPYRIDERNAGTLASRRAPAWTFLTGLKSTLSSTRLRNPDGSWKDDGAQ